MMKITAARSFQKTPRPSRKASHTASPTKPAKESVSQAQRRAQLESTQGSPKGKKRRDRRAKAAAAAKTPKSALPVPSSTSSPSPSPFPPQNVPSYKSRVAQLKGKAITNPQEYYEIYSLAKLWKEMGKPTTLLAEDRIHLSPAGANAIAYLMEVLLKKEGWDRISIGRLAKYKNGVARTSLESIKNCSYRGEGYMKIDAKKWRLPWLVDYVAHLAKHPPPGSRSKEQDSPCEDTDEDHEIEPHPANDVETMKEILILGGSSPTDAATGQIAQIVVEKYGITKEALSTLARRNEHGVPDLREDVVYYQLGKAMAERRAQNKADYDLEKIDVAMELAFHIAKGWSLHN